MERDQLEIHNQEEGKENLFIDQVAESGRVKYEKEIFHMGHEILENSKIKEENEAEGYQFPQNKIVKIETVEKEDDRIENNGNTQKFSSTTSEEDVFNSYRMNSCDEEDEKKDWEEIIQTFFNTNSKEDVLNLIRLNSCDEEDEQVDGEEIIQTFFNTNSKEDVLNVIRLDPNDEENENMDGEEIIHTFFCSSSKEDVLKLFGLDESYFTQDASETSDINIDNYIQPHFHISDIRKLIKSVKQKIRQQIVRTKKKSTNITFICDECKKEFSSWWLRRRHWIDTEHKQFEMCAACNEPYFYLQKHMYIKHSETLFNCNKCGKAFTSQADVDNHSSVHSDKQNSYCFVCNKNIDKLEALKKHVTTHFNLMLLMCDVCEMEFVDYSVLEQHTRLFHYTCPVCNKIFNMAPSLYEHYRQVHKNMVSFSCKSCDKYFKSKSKLKEHIKRVHLKQFPFSCSECDQKFVSKPKLKNHIIVKHEQKQFECDICGKKFSFQGSLISHKKFHSENKKVEFKCEFCNAVYERKVQLHWHLRGSFLIGFFCKPCEINFDCRTKYEEHVKEHKEKNIEFMCNYCPYFHETESIVKHHMSTKHSSEYLESNKNAVNCQVCGHLCSSKHELCRHQRKKHGLFRAKRRRRTE